MYVCARGPRDRRAERAVVASSAMGAPRPYSLVSLDETMKGGSTESSVQQPSTLFSL